MKKLLFVPCFSADTFHAIQKRYVALDQHLRGQMNFIWCLPPDDPAEWRWQDPKRKGEKPGILVAVEKSNGQIVRFPVHRGSFLKRVRGLRALLRDVKPDGVYAMFNPRFAPLYAAKSLGLTTIWDAAWNSLYPPCKMRFAKKFFYRWYIDHFMAASPFIAENLQSNGIPPERIHVRWSALDLRKVPQVDAAEARPRIRAELGLPADSKLVLQLTSFEWSKNTPMAVRALSHLLERHANLYWLLVGEEGPMLAETRALAKELGVEEHLVITGYRRDVWDLLAAADVSALTSRTEGLPNCLLESLAARRVAVTTRCNGAECIVRDGVEGFVVEQDDAESMAARIAEVLDDPDSRARRAAIGRRRIEQEFDMPRWCERAGRILAACLEPGAGNDVADQVHRAPA